MVTPESVMVSTMATNTVTNMVSRDNGSDMGDWTNFDG